MAIHTCEACGDHDAEQLHYILTVSGMQWWCERCLIGRRAAG